MKKERSCSTLCTVVKVLAVLCTLAAAVAIAIALVKKFGKKKCVCDEDEDVLDDACCGCILDEDTCDCSTCGEKECVAEEAAAAEELADCCN